MSCDPYLANHSMRLFGLIKNDNYKTRIGKISSNQLKLKSTLVEPFSRWSRIHVFFVVVFGVLIGVKSVLLDSKMSRIFSSINTTRIPRFF